MYKYRTSVYIEMETSIKTAFNVVFKEFITHIRNETSDKDLKAAIKQKYKKFETEGDVFRVRCCGRDDRRAQAGRYRKDPL
jgi:tRNA(Ser,Leu) C12 N-acetylase TAN1